MAGILLVAVMILAIIMIANKRKNNATGNVGGGNQTSKAPASREEASQKTKINQTRVDHDKELLKKIFIYGGIGCVIIAIILCVAMFKTGDPDAVGIGFIAVLAVIAIGSMSSNKKNKKSVKNYFVDEMNKIHSPGDLDFEYELIRYSEYNEHRYLKPIPISQRNEYIIDGKGNKVDIRSKRFYMRDNENNPCYIKMI